jgi:L-lysine 2,3-aminomutase
VAGSSPVTVVVRPAPPHRERYRGFNARNFREAPGADALTDELSEDIATVAAVFPFKTNAYVCEELIDWTRIPEDPMFQLTFPQREMLAPADFVRLRDRLATGGDRGTVAEIIAGIRAGMNPHPDGQRDLNAVCHQGMPLRGVQQQFDQSLLFFPAQGQTCHAYCTFCFRWPQFVGATEDRFAQQDVGPLVDYLHHNPSVTDVIFTGGDPLVMRSAVLGRYIEPLLSPSLDHLNLRIGTKSLSYWPYRFTTDDDAGDLLRLFEAITSAGRHLTLMVHFSHPRELETAAAGEAIRRIRDTGAVLRCQSPVVRHVNDSPALWQELISLEVRHGLVPYYMFVERQTGAHRYFSLPLARALEIYRESIAEVSGLGRTLRGPVMSTAAGKIVIDDVVSVHDVRVFVLRLLNAREKSYSNRVFFAAYDPDATWLTDLRPAFGAEAFCFASTG